MWSRLVLNRWAQMIPHLGQLRSRICAGWCTPHHPTWGDRASQGNVCPPSRRVSVRRCHAIQQANRGGHIVQRRAEECRRPGRGQPALTDHPSQLAEVALRGRRGRGQRTDNRDPGSGLSAGREERHSLRCSSVAHRPTSTSGSASPPCLGRDLGALGTWEGTSIACQLNPVRGPFLCYWFFLLSF